MIRGFYPMNTVKTKGLILKSASYGEGAKMLTVLSGEYGKISVAAKGAVSARRGAAALGNFCYSEFILNKHSEIYSLSDVSPIESFFGLSKSLDYMQCSADMMRFADYVSHENASAAEVLRLSLNCLYAMAFLLRRHTDVFTVYLLRMMCELGFNPELHSCCACGSESGLTAFSAEYGGIMCAECAENVAGIVRISPSAHSLMQYICGCPQKQIFKFSADEKTVLEALNIVKLFISEHLNYRFD